MTTFGYWVQPGDAHIVEWAMDYGDGRGYASSTKEDAEKNLYWHEYKSPGSFLAVATVTDSEGRTGTDTCTNTFSWSAQPVGGSGGSGGGIGGSWSGCYFNGVPMWGKVQVVDYLADFDVQVVDYLADLDVQAADYIADSCGEWVFVDYVPDFTVRFVSYVPDFTIRFVDYLPGR